MSNIRYSLLLLLFLLPYIYGCATTQNLPADLRTNTYNATYNDTFRAIVQVLSEDGYALNTADSETGIIDTDYHNVSTLQAIFTGDERTKVNAILSEESNGTQVRLNVSVQQRGALTGWQSASMSRSQAGNYYEELFNKIGRQLSE